MKWQERYARWILKPRWGQSFIERFSPWWVYLLFGVIVSAPFFWGARNFGVEHSYFETIAEQRIEKTATEENVEDLEKSLDWMVQINEEYLKTCRSFLVLLGAFLLFQVVFTGLLWEERKGYRMIIDRLDKAEEENEDT